MLEKMLANGEDCVQCGEVAGAIRLRQPFPEHLQLLENTPESQFHFQASKLCPTGIVTDSAKDRCWVVKSHLRAIRNGMRVVNLLIWKSPTELAYSRWRRREIGTGRGRWDRQWLRIHSFFVNAGMPLCTIRCSDLQQHPASVLKRICDVTGMRYFPGKERFWESAHVQIGGSPTARGSSSIAGIASDSSFPAEFESLRIEAQRFEELQAVKKIVQRLQKYDVSQTYSDPAAIPSLHSRLLVYTVDPFKRAHDRRTTANYR